MCLSFLKLLSFVSHYALYNARPVYCCRCVSAFVSSLTMPLSTALLSHTYPMECLRWREVRTFETLSVAQENHLQLPVS